MLDVLPEQSMQSKSFNANPKTSIRPCHEAHQVGKMFTLKVKGEVLNGKVACELTPKYCQKVTNS
jgi:hypothetical protein